MLKKAPPESLSPTELAFMSELNECQLRHYLAERAISLGKHGVSKISEKMGHCKNTIRQGIKELHSGYIPGEGCVRRPGGGRKSQLPLHPEWIETFRLVIEPHLAGLPQDENVFWVSLTIPQIRRGMVNAGCEISAYHVRQILESLGFRKRTFLKDLPMRDAKERDAQFLHIAEVRKMCAELGIPIISIDTKKKELIGNFHREGKALCIGQPKSFDHDFETFADGKIVPHGIYDVATNTGYMTLGTNHDTSQFVCDNIQRVWETHLKYQYPDAHTIVVLCDGGGSNASAHRIVKQDLMKLANRLEMNILVMHYPPYCSKYNPIEHLLFSQVNRSWNGAPLISIEDAARRAAMTTTKTGLTVHVDINTKTYEIKRSIDKEYERRLRWQIIFDPNLPKWNYLVKPLN